MRKQVLSYMITVFFLTSLLWAQQGPKLKITITEEKVNISADEVRTGIITYTPGDTILYILTSKNVGDALMTNPVITDPIPAGASYIENTSEGGNSEILFSIDGGKAYSAWPVYYSVRNSRGIIVRHKASADMITHIQWIIQESLEAGASHISTFKVVVNP